LCILSAVFQLRALMYVLCAFVILNKDYLLTYLLTYYRKLFSLVTVAVFKLRLKTSFPRLSLLPLLTNTLFGPSAPEVTTLWRYTNLSTMNVYI